MQPLFTKKKISNQIINCTPTFSVFFFFRKFKFLNFPLFFSYFTIFFQNFWSIPILKLRYVSRGRAYPLPLCYDYVLYRWPQMPKQLLTVFYKTFYLKKTKLSLYIPSKKRKPLTLLDKFYFMINFTAQAVSRSWKHRLDGLSSRPSSRGFHPASQAVFPSR